MTLRDRNLVRCLLLCAAFITANLASAQGLFGPIQAGDTAAFQAALQAGADTNATDEYGQTPLMYAVTFNQPDMVEALITAGANVNAKTLAGWTALHYAARDATDNRIIEALLAAGADPAARSHDGQTPDAIATSVGNDAAAVALEAAATLAPTITGTEPEAIPPSESRQWVTVLGNGFAHNAVVTLSAGEAVFPIPVERTERVDSRAIRVFAGLFPTDAGWTAQVANPGGEVSNRYTLRFEHARATVEPVAEQSPGWRGFLGTAWTGPQVVLDHPLCREAGCRYLRAEPFVYDGTLYFTEYLFSTQQPPGVMLSIAVTERGAARLLNRVSIVAVRIENVNRYPVRGASTLMSGLVRQESDTTAGVDVVDLCFAVPDISTEFAVGSTRSYGGLRLTCAVSYGNAFTGRMLPNPTFQFQIARED